MQHPPNPRAFSSMATTADGQYLKPPPKPRGPSTAADYALLLLRKVWAVLLFVLLLPVRLVPFLKELAGWAKMQGDAQSFVKKTMVWEQGREKCMAWTAPLAMADINSARKALSAASGGQRTTVNDLLVGVIASALRRFLLLQTNPATGSPYSAEEIESEVQVVIPATVRAPWDVALDNQSTGVILRLPMDQPGVGGAVAEVRRRMMVIKESIAIPFGYFFLSVLARLPYSEGVANHTLDFMARMHGYITNVGGPTEQLLFAGHAITDMVPYLFQPGQGGIGFAIFTYNGQCRVSSFTDKDTLKPGSPILMDLISEEFLAILQSAQHPLSAAAAAAAATKEDE